MVMKAAKQQGVALLMVLLALALISAGLPWLLQQGRQELDSARGVQLKVQARIIETAAYAFVQQAFTDPAWRHNPLFWQAMRGYPLSYSFPEGNARLLIRDLRTCFNLNALLGEEREKARRQLSYLLSRRLGALSAEQYSQQILDWLDADDQPELLGAESTHYLRQLSPYRAANRPMRDLSELNLIPYWDAQRYLQYPELCALPERSGWRLNINALTLEHLFLLEALYEGEVSRSLLTRLITARPASGYVDSQAVRQAVGALKDSSFARLAAGLVFNTDYALLGLETTLHDQTFRVIQQVEAQGVSRGHARISAQSVRFRARRPAPFWQSDDVQIHASW